MRKLFMIDYVRSQHHRYIKTTCNEALFNGASVSFRKIDLNIGKPKGLVGLKSTDARGPG